MSLHPTPTPTPNPNTDMNICIVFYSTSSKVIIYIQLLCADFGPQSLLHNLVDQLINFK